MDPSLIENPTFHDGLQGWKPMGCQLSVVDSPMALGCGRLPELPGARFTSTFCCVAFNRTEPWQGVAQEIQDRLRARIDYDLQALVSVEGSCAEATVLATLKLESTTEQPQYITLAKDTVRKGQWTLLKGRLRVDSSFTTALLYVEGPPPGVTILLACLFLTSANAQPTGPMTTKGEAHLGSGGDSVVLNSEFRSSTQGWTAISCVLSLKEGGLRGAMKASTGLFYAVVSQRTASWQGVEQDIAGRLSPNTTYSVEALVAVSDGSHDVIATLRLESKSAATRYMTLGRVVASDKGWAKIQGDFHLETVWEKVIFYVEGPPPSVDLLVDSVEIRPSLPAVGTFFNAGSGNQPHLVSNDGTKCATSNPIQNWNFEDGLEGWYCDGCKLSFSVAEKCAIVSSRSAEWQGIQQDISGRLQGSVPYEITATVRLHGLTGFAPVIATLYIQDANGAEQYVSMGRVDASAKEWVELTGRLALYKLPFKAVAYLEGPPCGVDMLVRSFCICPPQKAEPAERPVFAVRVMEGQMDPKYDVNVIENSSFSRGLTSWSPMGSCQLYVASDGPNLSSATQKSSLQWRKEIDVRCIVATNRKYVWEGPMQDITKKIQTFLTYQVSAWVRTARATGPQKVNVALGVDSKWVNGGQVEVDSSGSWTQVTGSFRLEYPHEEALVYIQGPDPGVDIMSAGLHISAVDHKARIAMLKECSEKVRQREVCLTVRDPSGRVLPSQSVQLQQISNTFPLGSCINRRSLYNPGYVKFFLDNFNWAVFENEMKWTWIEPSKGQLNYKDADELLEFCSEHGIPVRGHCIFWEVEETIQAWLKELSKPMLGDAVQSRIVDLLSRYKGRFKHYDVNNETLHGSFFRDRLGHEIISYMFKLCSQFDPSATLFVNDYHIEDGCDADSSPSKCVGHVQDLQRQGAVVGGIGVQGHVDAPVGSIICQSLEILRTAGVPIWLTEVDVSSSNEYIRADDLEVVLREAFAHPAVEGVLLWGFWEGSMSREAAQLVNWDMSLTEAGRRLIALKQEWLTNITSDTNGAGQVQFRGFKGQYKLAAAIAGKMFQQTFQVTDGDGPLMIDVTL